ncbi:hypothetical protein BT93_K2217 [Corymbia citriodora subsp. variegata]|nr:hypothetical protein BT93_K2217 [Corymbia citriodora subsp. variegata]
MGLLTVKCFAGDVVSGEYENLEAVDASGESGETAGKGSVVQVERGLRSTRQERSGTLHMELSLRLRTRSWSSRFRVFLSSSRTRGRARGPAVHEEGLHLDVEREDPPIWAITLSWCFLPTPFGLNR